MKALSTLLIGSTLLFSAAAVQARPVTLTQVRAAPTLRKALQLARKMPQVRAALRRDNKIIIASRQPTAGEIAAGKLNAVDRRGWNYAGYRAEVALERGWLAPRVRLHARSLRVWGHVAPGAPALPNREHSLANLMVKLGESDQVKTDQWAFRWQQPRRWGVATWRASKRLRQIQGTFPELSPKDVAEAIARALRPDAPASLVHTSAAQ
jgi:hypothetical protein